MKKSLYSAVCLAALLCLGNMATPVPSAAQVAAEVSFNTFHSDLAAYGDWVYSDRWGEVWVPGDVPDDFRPYDTSGHWVYTDYGWTWASDYEWGDITFHYGRWVFDPDAGWLWLPGYVWSPAWVVWRSNDRVIGWMPMPPDREFLTGASVDVESGGLRISINFNDTGDYYGYRDWYGPSFSEARFAGAWVFVSSAHLADRDYHPYIEPRTNYTTIIHNTTNITNYTVQNNYVVNKSVDVKKVEQAGGQPVKPVRAAEVVHKAQFIASVDKGKQAQAAAAAEAPRGTGRAGSAPAPTPEVAQRLSDKLPTGKRGEAAHLYTKSTVQNAPLTKAAGAPSAQPGSTQQSGKTVDQGAEANRQKAQGEKRKEQTATPETPSTAPRAPDRETMGSGKAANQAPEVGRQKTPAEGQKEQAATPKPSPAAPAPGANPESRTTMPGGAREESRQSGRGAPEDKTSHMAPGPARPESMPSRTEAPRAPTEQDRAAKPSMPDRAPPPQGQGAEKQDLKAHPSAPPSEAQPRAREERAPQGEKPPPQHREMNAPPQSGAEAPPRPRAEPGRPPEKEPQANREPQGHGQAGPPGSDREKRGGEKKKPEDNQPQ